MPRYNKGLVLETDDLLAEAASATCASSTPAVEKQVTDLRFDSRRCPMRRRYLEELIDVIGPVGHCLQSCDLGSALGADP